MQRKLILMTLTGLAILLGACGPTTPLYGPNSPRNGAGEPVDLVYGTPLPGYAITNARGP